MRRLTIWLFLLGFGLLLGARVTEAREQPPATPPPEKGWNYSAEDVKRLNDFATTIGSSMACGANIEEDVQLVTYWAAAIFGPEAPEYLKTFSNRVEQVMDTSMESIARREGITCVQIKQMREATIAYLRTSLYLYRLEGRAPTAPPPNGRPNK